MKVVAVRPDTSAMGCFGNPAYRVTLLSDDGKAWELCGAWPIGSTVSGYWVEGSQGTFGHVRGFHLAKP